MTSIPPEDPLLQNGQKLIPAYRFGNFIGDDAEIEESERGAGASNYVFDEDDRDSRIAGQELMEVDGMVSVL